MTEPSRISFTRPVWATFALFGLLLLGLLGTQVAMLEDQRSTTDQQLAATAKQADAAVPLIRETLPLVQQTKRDLPRSRQLTRSALRLTQTATPLLRQLDDARAPEQLQAAGALARSLLNADVATATRQLTRADLPALSHRLSAVADELLVHDRLRRTLVRTASVLGEVQALHTVEKGTRAAETVPRIERVLRESLEVQRQTLAQARAIGAVTVELRDIGVQTREQARTAAKAAESIDRKTGPSLATTSGG